MLLSDAGSVKATTTTNSASEEMHAETRNMLLSRAFLRRDNCMYTQASVENEY